MLVEDDYFAFDNDLGDFDPDYDYLESHSSHPLPPPPLADPPPRVQARTELYENYTRALWENIELSEIHLRTTFSAALHT